MCGISILISAAWLSLDHLNVQGEKGVGHRDVPSLNLIPPQISKICMYNVIGNGPKVLEHV